MTVHRGGKATREWTNADGIRCCEVDKPGLEGEVCVDARDLAKWLLTIDPNEIDNPTKREAFVRFQREAAAMPLEALDESAEQPPSHRYQHEARAAREGSGRRLVSAEVAAPTRRGGLPPHLWKPRKRLRDLTGVVVGHLTVERRAATMGWWWCKCRCGEVVLRSKRAITCALEGKWDSRCDTCKGRER